MGTRASIETAMHAVMPHRMVLHTHCVDTIAWAVRQDAPIHLKARLHGLRWQWVPYVPSGLALAQEIQRALSAFGTDVFILGNHGLVLGGDDCRAEEDLLFDVQRRLTIHPRHAPHADCISANGTGTMMSSRQASAIHFPDALIQRKRPSFMEALPVLPCVNRRLPPIRADNASRGMSSGLRFPDRFAFI